MDLIPLYKSKRKNILVIGGGGLKGFSALGACEYLYKNDILKNPEIYAGTSIGAFITSLLSIGLSVKNIFDVLCKLNFDDFFDLNFENFFLQHDHYGMATLDNLITVTEICFEKKGYSKNITFKELYQETNNKLIITGTCLNKFQTKYFSCDETPNFKVIDAIRISASVPIIFESIKTTKNNYDTTTRDEEPSNSHYWSDGGIMDNYPIQIFNNKLEDVIGIYMLDLYKEVTIDDIQSYFTCLFKCMWKGSNYYKLEIYKNQTITIECENEAGYDFSISNEDKLKMFNLGYSSAEKYYENKIL